MTDSDRVSQTRETRHEVKPRVKTRRPIDEAALMRKIDFKLIPILIVVYMATFIDRVNVSNALVLGMVSDLQLDGTRANLALAVFFIPYVLFEIPSNLVLKRTRPRVWLPTCMLSFGLIMVGQGFVESYGGILATRVLLGLAEAGMFPGCFYLISMWYKPEEAQKRFTAFSCSAGLSQCFGGLLAGAIATMDGVGGMRGWRWIFILEGAATIVLAGIASIFIMDFPDQATWLTPRERAFVVSRIGDRSFTRDPQAGQPSSKSEIMALFKDITPYLGALMYFSILVPSYSLAYFIPTVVNNLGYNSVQTQLHTVPPIAAGLGFCIVTAIGSDALQLRYPFVLLSSLLVLAGSLMLMNVHDSFAPQYAGLALVAMGCQASIPTIICWFTMNLDGHTQRSIGTAWMIGFGNLGGILATFTFLARERPTYSTAYSVVVACIGLNMVVSGAYAIVIWRRKKTNLRLVV